MGNFPKENYDIVIIGAGPSGAATARYLVYEGFNVLVIEKKKLPRYKICSGIIFEKSQEIIEKHFGKIPQSVCATPNLLKGVRLWTDTKHFSDWPFSKYGGATNIWRSEFDYWLIKNSGAEIKDCCLLNEFTVHDNFISLKCFDTTNKEIIKIKCKYLVSAEGSKSAIRAKLDSKFEKDINWFIAHQNYYEGVCDLDPYFYHGFLEQQYSDVYAWFSVKDNLLVFGIAVKKGNKISPYLNKYTEMLEKKFDLKLRKLARKTSCMGNNMCATGSFYLGKGNILIVGEAAGFLNAFGEGISCALSSGLYAAEAITKSIKYGGNALDTYTELTKTERRQTTLSWKLGSKVAGRELLAI